MAVVLARVDDRLLHGQVVEAWVPHVSAEMILVVSDTIALDSGRCELMRLILPRNLELMVIPPGKLRTVLRKSAETRVLLLFEDLEDVLVVLGKGVVLDRVNVGNLHHLKGGIEVTPSVFLNRRDLEMVKDLVSRGITVEAREVPDGRSLDLIHYITKT